MDETTQAPARSFYGLADLITRSNESRIAKAKQRYAELIEAKDPDSVEELEEVAATIGKSADQIVADIQTMKQALELEEKILANKDVVKASFDVRDNFEAYKLETKRLIAEREKQTRVLDREDSEASNRRCNAQALGQRLSELVNKNHDLLVGVRQRGVKVD